MSPEERRMMLDYMRKHGLAVVSTVSAAGAPQAALVGVAVTDGLEIVFDTVSTSRKHGNLIAESRAAVTFSGPGEQTLQLEGQAQPSISKLIAILLIEKCTTRSGQTGVRAVRGQTFPIGELPRNGFVTATTTGVR